MCRFYDPTEGDIQIGDYEIRDVTMSSLRSKFGAVPQAGRFFTYTLRVFACAYSLVLLPHHSGLMQCVCPLKAHAHHLESNLLQSDHSAHSQLFYDLHSMTLYLSAAVQVSCSIQLLGRF